MPGTKIELKTGDDPDPAPFLFVSAELKAKILEKPYDPKRSCYVPHSEEKFCEGLVEETNGNKVKVKIVVGESKGDVKEYKQDLVAQVQYYLQFLQHLTENASNKCINSFLMHDDTHKNLI